MRRAFRAIGATATVRAALLPICALCGMIGMADARPEAPFRGCSGLPPASEEAAAPDRGANAERVRPRSGRALAPQEPIAEREPDEPDCRLRVDGLWVDDTRPALDTSVELDGWDSDVPELLSMANSTFTRPRTLAVTVGEDASLVVRDVFDPGSETVFVSTDGVPLAHALGPEGQTKRYVVSGYGAVGRSLVVDRTYTGRPRLRIDGKDHFRPERPNVSRGTGTGLDPDDAFEVGLALDKLEAVRRGYDVVTQDPFYIMDRPKAEVFDDTRAFFVDEKKLVPLGHDLVPDSSQGMVFKKSLVTSASEFQETMSRGYGGRLFKEGGRVEGSIAAEYTRSQVSSLKKANSVAQAIGYSRHKQYAIILDQPYARLSDPFLDKVFEAVSSDRDRDYDAIIAKFGTHYAHAVTYGANAKVTQSFTEEQLAETFGETTDFSAEITISLFGKGGSAHHSRADGTSGSRSGTIGEEGATFVAVGGNGSWDQNGYSAGADAYPILLDLRPIEELLNPIHFPGDERTTVYGRMRLAARVRTYLEARADRELLASYFGDRTGLSGRYYDRDVLTYQFVFAPAAGRAIDVTHFGDGEKQELGVYKKIAPGTYRNELNSDMPLADRPKITLQPDRSVVAEFGNQPPLVLYPMDEALYPASADLSGTFRYAGHPDAATRFEMLTPNTARLTELSTGQTYVMHRTGPDTFGVPESYRYRVAPSGGVTFTDLKADRTVKYEPFVPPDTDLGLALRGTYYPETNASERIVFEMLAPDLVRAAPSWSDGGTWRRAGPSAFGVAGYWTYKINGDGTVTYENKRDGDEVTYLPAKEDAASGVVTGAALGNP